MTHWEIGNSGRAWRSGEAFERYALIPEKTEMIGGKLFDSDEEREVMLCLLLENVGADRAVQFGNPAVWKDAVAKLDDNRGLNSPLG